MYLWQEAVKKVLTVYSIINYVTTYNLILLKDDKIH